MLRIAYFRIPAKVLVFGLICWDDNPMEVVIIQLYINDETGSAEHSHRPVLAQMGWAYLSVRSLAGHSRSFPGRLSRLLN
jgi:hypothetical protein